MADERTVNRNLEIEGLPIETDRIINTIAMLRGTTKKNIVKEALIEYAAKHREDVVNLLPQ